MTYTGEVSVGGPHDLRRLDEIEIRKLAVGPLANGVYLLTCRRTGAQLLVDAADAPDDETRSLLAVVLTAATGVAVTRRLRHGDALRVGAVSLEVVALRGHTPGSVALAYREPDDVDEPDAAASGMSRPGRP